MIDTAKIYQLTAQSLSDLTNSAESTESRLNRIYRLISYLLTIEGEKEGLHFSTLFARMAYFISKYAMPPNLASALHQFRITVERSHDSGDTAEEKWVHTGVFCLASLLKYFDGSEDLSEILDRLPEGTPHLIPKPVSDSKFLRVTSFVASGFHEESGCLVGFAESSDVSQRLNFSDPGRSELYRSNVLAAIKLLGWPFKMSLIDIEVSSEGVLSPRMIVIEPDYLVDVTAVAECFQVTGADPRMHLVSMFIPREWNSALLLGSIANYFLDELVNDPTLEFKDVVKGIFKLHPLPLMRYTKDDLLELLRKARSHFSVLKEVVNQKLPDLDIDPAASFIEPTFLAPDYGLQGRLDLYHKKSASESDIVELKSGRPYRANTHGLNSTHYAQTLLYDLMIRAVSKFEQKPSSYILYSSQTIDPLRYAPVVNSIQREAIKLRNDIFLVERQLAADPTLPARITPISFPSASGFAARNVARFATAYEQLSPLEKQYFAAYNKLILDEHYAAKVGSGTLRHDKGVARAWLAPLKEKYDDFQILHDLSIEEEPSEDTVILNKGSKTNPLANFRQGDIAVLYPDIPGEPQPVLRSQVFKCTITKLDESSVHVRLRSKQVNPTIFAGSEKWSLEHDLLDSGFRSMHRSLFEFMTADPLRRQLFLGIRPPVKPLVTGRNGKDHTVADIVGQIIAAPEYYLLWGPPGTGKTSVVVRSLVRHYVFETDKNILLLAYTNRAVDEMCRAVDDIGGDIRKHYLRIGSRISSGEDYKSQLLSNQMDSIEQRSELRELLVRQRVIIATISSIAGKPELRDLLNLDIAIIDEASQVLEPMLASILTSISKYVLIGDHQQLPAVVTLPEERTAVSHDDLNSIGIYNTRTSYFERMYLLAVRRGWDWAYGRLLQQGRMHTAIMEFPARMFYGGNLTALEPGIIARDLTGRLRPARSRTQNLLAEERTIFIPSTPEADPLSKTNISEAIIVTSLLRQLGILFPAWDIGVITPFRAQIANITDRMLAAGMDPERYTVDTVERYQGGARDIIILSTSVNHEAQLDQVVSLSADGVDRKLNVAITRAREQFILLGVEAVLRENKLYSDLIDACTRMEMMQESHETVSDRS